MHTRVLPHDATFNLDDRIFLGEGLFETIRVAKAKPCFAFLHWQRLSQSAKRLGIPFEMSFEDWNAALVNAIQSDNLYSGGIKVILGGGSAPRGLLQQGHVSHLAFQAFNVSLSTNPISLIAAPWVRDAQNPVYHMKTVNYLEAIQARRYAVLQGADDVLFLNMQQHITETTCANLFVIVKDSLYTPPLTDGLLAGVTRGRVISYCQQLNIKCIEQSLLSESIDNADAVFVTNALQGVVVVSSWDGKPIHTTHHLLQEFSTFAFQDVLEHRE